MVALMNVDWRVQMHLIFYLIPHQKCMDVADSSDKINIQRMFPNLRGMKISAENFKSVNASF